MKEFMGKDFLLDNETAKALFAAADKMPIFDWHCHLSPKEIYENRQPADIAELWLAGDHYKWRAMRSCGIDEELITGSASGFEKFQAWAGVMPYLIGNPLYHWTHLELQRYFGIYDTLSAATAQSIWERANAKIAEGGFTPRELIDASNVKCLCTTDDPADSLEYHILLAKETGFKCRVLPAFRPDKSLNIDQPVFLPWLASLESAAGIKIDSFDNLKAALAARIDFFDSLGCRASDQAVAAMPFLRATEQELDGILAKVKRGVAVSSSEIEKYRTAVLLFLGEKYAEKGWAMELHMGAMRNNNAFMFKKLGPDTGFDSIDDREVAVPLSRFLDALAEKERLPKTILFTLNPKDNYVLGSMLGNFQSTEAASKLQFGSAWWFNDNIDGMREQMKALANLGSLAKFVGMVTDSRSFLSYPRHEYFRRIFCGLVGDMVEQGLYPNDLETLCAIAQDVSFNNAAKYFKI